MNNPLVSVIIPNYCHSLFLDQRISSVLNQTYKNFEIIILDDASPDYGASKSIIEKYRGFHQVKEILYNKKNSGSSFRQWNKGFELAKGDLIWIAESDDFCDEDLLSLMVKQFEFHQNLVIAYCSSQFVNERGEKIGHIHSKTGKIQFYKGRDFIVNRMLRGNAINNASSALFKRRFLSQIGRDYMEYVAAGDKLFWVKLAEFGDVAHIYDAKNYFRQHSNKVSPAKLRNGTTENEDYKIVRYLELNGYVSIYDRLYTRVHYLEESRNIDFYSNEIRQSVENLWTYNGWLSLFMMKKLMSIIVRYRKIRSSFYHKVCK